MGELLEPARRGVHVGAEELPGGAERGVEFRAVRRGAEAEPRQDDEGLAQHGLDPLDWIRGRRRRGLALGQLREHRVRLRLQRGVASTSVPKRDAGIEPIAPSAAASRSAARSAVAVVAAPSAVTVASSAAVAVPARAVRSSCSAASGRPGSNRSVERSGRA